MNFFLTNVCFLMWLTKWWCKEIDKKKIKQFCDKTFWKFFVGTEGVISFTLILWRLTSNYIPDLGKGRLKTKNICKGQSQRLTGSTVQSCLLKGEDGNFKNGVWWGFEVEDNLEIMDIVQKLLKMALAHYWLSSSCL